MDMGAIVTDKPVVSRAAIVATIVASILAFSSSALAASDAEIGHLKIVVRSAFRCSTYASMFDDQKEQQRLFQIGLKAARDFVDGLKSQNNPTLSAITAYLGPVSTDFIVGRAYESETTKAYDEIVKYDDGLPRK